jgi:hypothetical protein
MKKAETGRLRRPVSAFFICLNLEHYACPSVNLKFGMSHVFIFGTSLAQCCTFAKLVQGIRWKPSTIARLTGYSLADLQVINICRAGMYSAEVAQLLHAYMRAGQRTRQRLNRETFRRLFRAYRKYQLARHARQHLCPGRVPEHWRSGVPGGLVDPVLTKVRECSVGHHRSPAVLYPRL